MGVLSRFLELDARDRWCLVQSWWVLMVVRFLLWVVPYQSLVRLLDRTSRLSPKGAGAPDHIPIAVMRAARAVPAATCLVQALAGRWMLRRAGQDATIGFGVAFGEAGFQAHAWLEFEERILIGAAEEATHHRLER